MDLAHWGNSKADPITVKKQQILKLHHEFHNVSHDNSQHNEYCLSMQVTRFQT